STCKKVLKLAPTGVAALNIKGVTIHKAFEYENLEVLPYNLINKDNVFFRPNKLRVLKEAETLIIDEISMVNAEIFDRIDQLLRIACDSDELFAGKHIILFGDVFQLPPVLTSNRYYDYKKRYGSVYFFNSPPFKLGGFRFIELTVNHRQEEDKAYFDMLNRLRENGSFDNSDLETLNSRYVSDRSQLRRMITLYPRKENVNIINKKELDAIDAPVFTYHAQVVINEKNDQTTNFENRFPISETLELKVGALIMMVQNDIFNRWVNGTLGIVSSLGADEVFVTIDGVEYEVKRATFDEREPRYVNGKIKYFPVFSVSQFPLVIAYAVTIHKAQGMTYKQIACDLSECFAPGQSYVALSRCESLEGLHLLNKLSPETVGVDKEVLDFYHQSFPTHE
ncbi:MAG: AAA family ATPase, partial [Eubacterium sp.]|nr:AAA family ATPase [Eubacterium sp.]